MMQDGDLKAPCQGHGPPPADPPAREECARGGGGSVEGRKMEREGGGVLGECRGWWEGTRGGSRSARALQGSTPGPISNVQGVIGEVMRGGREGEEEWGGKRWSGGRGDRWWGVRRGGGGMRCKKCGRGHQVVRAIRYEV